jgi:type II secretory pathway pseudopilin PulG
MADSTGSSSAPSATKKSNPAVVLGSIVIVFALLAGIGWYVQGRNKADDATQAVADANKAAADLTQAAAAQAQQAMATANQQMAAANQQMAAMAPPAGAAAGQPGAMSGQQPAGATPAPAPEPMAAPARTPKPAAKTTEKPKKEVVAAKKTETTAGKASSAHMSPTAAKVAECKRIGNLFERQTCMMKVCSNKWGTEGCPDYKKNEPLNGGG